jgi:hypothetical protein
MQENPYRNQPNKSFWSRSVSRDFNASELVSFDSNISLFKEGDRVVSAGSCFASNLIPWIEREGLEYLRTEVLPLPFQHLPENLGYRNFSAAYGNIYTARHLRQLYEQSLGLRAPIEDRWHVDGKVIDPFRPGLAYPAESDAEFDLGKVSHLRAVREAFHSASVFVFTLGLTEAWQSISDGSVFPACPGTIAGNFDDSHHEFKNFEVQEIIDDLASFITQLRLSNPTVRFVITVSPVPLVATATDSHVLVASTYSKSVLRVAAEKISKDFDGVTYFPAYEIVTGPQAPFEYFERDRRNVTEVAVAEVMQSLLFGFSPSELAKKSDDKSTRRLSGRFISDLAKRIARADCDEAMLDQGL